MKNKRKIKNSKDHYTGALLESMDSKIDGLIDAHKFSDEKIDRLEKKVDGGFEKVDRKFEIVFDELHLIRNELKEKVGRDEFVFLEKRVIALEKARIR